MSHFAGGNHPPAAELADVFNMLTDIQPEVLKSL